MACPQAIARGISNVHEVDAVMSEYYLKKTMKKQDGTEYKVTMRIENLSLPDQVEFIGKVANFAITKYGIKYPNPNEINKSK